MYRLCVWQQQQKRNNLTPHHQVRGRHRTLHFTSPPTPHPPPNQKQHNIRFKGPNTYHSPATTDKTPHPQVRGGHRALHRRRARHAPRPRRLVPPRPRAHGPGAVAQGAAGTLGRKEGRRGPCLPAVLAGGSVCVFVQRVRHETKTWVGGSCLLACLSGSPSWPWSSGTRRCKE